MTVTCNAGIKLLPRPDYYFAIDQNAGRNYQDMARDAQSAGTVCVTLSRDMRAMKDRCVDWFDIHLTLPDSGSPRRGGYGPFRYSGPLCVQFACNQGASRVILAGCDGYREHTSSKLDGCYFDHDQPERHQKPLRANWATNATREVIEPQTRMICEAWRDVEFVCHGDPAYTVDSPNWRVIPLDEPCGIATNTSNQSISEPASPQRRATG